MPHGCDWCCGPPSGLPSTSSTPSGTPRHGNGKSRTRRSDVAPPRPRRIVSYRSLRDFIAKLESERELVRVREHVSTVLELTEIQTRLMAEQGPAAFFGNVTKVDGAASEFPVLVNLFGTVRRVAMAVSLGGVERRDAKSLREVGELLATLRQPEPPRSIGEVMDLLPLVRSALTMRPKTIGSPHCQEVVLRGAHVDLERLPVQACW